MARVNVAVALALIAVIFMALTPWLSPFRLAADSQYRRILAHGVEPATTRPRREYLRGASPLSYLHFDSGQYGRERLSQLAHTQSGGDAARTRGLAAAELKHKTPWEEAAHDDPAQALAKMHIYPAGRGLDEDLSRALLETLTNESSSFCCREQVRTGLYIDLNGDKSDEFVLFTDYGGMLYEHRGDRWVRIGELSRRAPSAQFDVDMALGKSDYSVSAPRWNELTIDGHRFSVQVPDKEPAR